MLPVSTEHQSSVTLASLHTGLFTLLFVWGHTGGRTGRATGLIVTSLWTGEGWGGDQLCVNMCCPTRFSCLRPNFVTSSCRYNIIQEKQHLFASLLTTFCNRSPLRADFDSSRQTCIDITLQVITENLLCT